MCGHGASELENITNLALQAVSCVFYTSRTELTKERLKLEGILEFSPAKATRSQHTYTMTSKQILVVISWNEKESSVQTNALIPRFRICGWTIDFSPFVKSVDSKSSEFPSVVDISKEYATIYLEPENQHEVGYKLSWLYLLCVGAIDSAGNSECQKCRNRWEL